MARFEVRVPDLGESAHEARVVRWYCQLGERIAEDEPVLELETDKANMEVPSPAAGRLAEMHVGEGQIVIVGELVGSIETDPGVPISGETGLVAERRTELDCLRCGARLEPSASTGGRLQLAGEGVHLLVCRRCGHVELIAEDPTRF